MSKFLFGISLISFFIVSCGGNDNKSSEGNNSVASNATQNGKKANQLNITVLLDLSDRIDIKKNPETPEHFERDISILKYFSEYFVQDMKNRGTFMAKGKFRIIFSPKPLDPNVNLYAEKLNINLSEMDNKKKKEIHDNLPTVVTENVSNIYKSTIEHSKWIGSDIWRFFKNDVKDYCVDRDPNYRNILVVLTDGYIYHKDSKDQVGNRYAYLLPDLIAKHHLRNNENWQSDLDKQDFGLITKTKDLQGLEVLVLEVTPSPNYKDDEDIIKSILGKWFKEMNVKRFGIFNSDLPEYTKQRISDFLK